MVKEEEFIHPDIQMLKDPGEGLKLRHR